VPGLAALNANGDAYVSLVSCGSAGNCAAGGYYRDQNRNYQGFVASERDGVWGQAIEVPGLGALNKDGYAEVNSVSCGSAGNCAAGGDSAAAGVNGYVRGFVVSEKNGVWGQAINVPGLGALNTGGGDAFVASVSCPSAGSCAAGGDYGSPYPWGFLVSEKNGVWGRAIDVPGLGALVTGRYADVFSVSCGSPGNCAAGGNYEEMPGGSQGYVVREKNGVWGRAIEVLGLGALNKGGSAFVDSVSCAPAGTCAAGGDYQDRRGHSQGFVVSQTG